MHRCPVLELIRGETGIAACLKAERDGALKPSYRKLIWAGGGAPGGDALPNLTAMEIGGKDYWLQSSIFLSSSEFELTFFFKYIHANEFLWF